MKCRNEELSVASIYKWLCFLYLKTSLQELLNKFVLTHAYSSYIFKTTDSYVKWALTGFQISAYNGEHLKTMYFLSGSSKNIEGAAKLINKN